MTSDANALGRDEAVVGKKRRQSRKRKKEEDFTMAAIEGRTPLAPSLLVPCYPEPRRRVRCLQEIVSSHLASPGLRHDCRGNVSDTMEYRRDEGQPGSTFSVADHPSHNGKDLALSGGS
ncbi:hypothetical protein KM043_009381 [Ampulex compressa]|nr:hypothetical protein KM043_009381 [Ampulex compressa]